MGLWSRLSTVFKAKASKLLERAEDPREVLDYSYERQLEMLVKVRRGLADVATSRKRVELQQARLEQEVARLEGEARKALGLGREDLARQILLREKELQAELQNLDAQHRSLQQEQEKLELAAKRLEAKVESFRVRKETIKARYTAAEAQAKIGEALSGISEELGDVGLAVERAEEKTQALQARAGAIEELLASGALEDLTSGRTGPEAELEAAAAAAGVEEELQALKAEVARGLPEKGKEGA
jgi:phage shock protein A